MNNKIKSEDFIKAFGNGVKETNHKIIIGDCKYYLPCGQCDKCRKIVEFYKIMDESEVTVSE